ncbi:hypothetical protein DFR65_1079 [Oceanihabitans sediminis]|uniref:hypothetical protein n=1 Tax=Oceanihabitans sediminis TaxID=1812012 RepID=UPI000E00A718|nr:hypothetical protein [Oceanihabitans sediminis]RBP28393.1 hypothetical protein DFR65_1079 [Oceanihabitans sediminis]
MKNLSSYLLFCILIILTTSCENDDDEVLNEEQEKLIKITEKIFDDNILISNTSINYTYGSNNYVTTELSSSGAEKHYYYNDDNQLTNYQTIDNGTLSDYEFEYNIDGLIINKLDSNDNIIYYYQYNSFQQLINVNDVLSLTYSNDGNIATKTDSNGNVDSYEYDNKNNPYKLLFPESVSKINFWNNNNIISENQTDYTIEYI